jgi:ribosomal protein S18 acetylase RimI-like enzyme
MAAMSEYIFTDALGYSMAQLAEMDNESFREYYIPIQTTPLDMARYCQRNSVDLSNTVVMRDGEQFVGMSMVATRGRRSWVAGFGIVPEYRGKGAGKALMIRTLEVTRAADLTWLQLEVLAQNTRAQRLYESSGFAIRRDVVGLKVGVEAIPKHASTARISLTDPEHIMDWLLQGQQPAWSRERASLLVVGGKAIVISRPGGATGAMLYQRREDRIQVLAVALIDRTSANDFAFMLRHVAEGVKTVNLHNEPDDSVLFQVCKDLGFEEEYRQHEMTVELEQ